MDRPEWMLHSKFGYPFGIAYNDGWRDGQKKLLEYLITFSKREGHSPEYVNRTYLQQMLKSLEEK